MFTIDNRNEKEVKARLVNWNESNEGIHLATYALAMIKYICVQPCYSRLAESRIKLLLEGPILSHGPILSYKFHLQIDSIISFINIDVSFRQVSDYLQNYLLRPVAV